MKFFEIVDRIDPVDFFNSFDEEDYCIDKVKAGFGVEDIILAKRAKYWIALLLIEKPRNF